MYEVQLKRLHGLYFEGFLNGKWLLSYKINYISYRDVKGFGGMLPEKFLKSLMQCVRFDVLF